MRRLVFLLLAGCAASDAPAEVEQRSCQVTFQIPVASDRRLDLLLLVDPDAARLPWFAANMEVLAQVLETQQGGLPDLHLAVASSADGRLDGAGCADANTFGDSFVCLTTAASTGEGLADPLAPLAPALATPGFARGGALGVFAVTTHPVTAEAAAAAAELLRSRRPWLTSGVVAPAAGADAWGELIDGPRGAFVAVEGADWSDLFIKLTAHLQYVIGAPCLQGPVTDADRCSVVDLDGSTRRETVLPRCPGGEGARPCWWTSLDPARCPAAVSPTELVLHVERDELPILGTSVVMRCPTCD